MRVDKILGIYALCSLPFPDDANNDLRGCFSIGTGQGNVSVSAQQVRALNLVAALHSDLGPVEFEQQRIAVFGAGLSGLTFAAAAASKGAAVTVLELREAPFGTWVDECTRPIHPNVLEWPRSNFWASPESQSRFFSWEAGELGALLRQNWRPELQKRLDNHEFELQLRVRDVTIERDKGDFVVSSSNVTGPQNFNQLVFATGFGPERELHLPDTAGSFGYWDWTKDNPRFGDVSRIKRTAIIGNGDGAVIDLVNSALVEPIDYPDLARVIDESKRHRQLQTSSSALEKQLATRSARTGNRSFRFREQDCLVDDAIIDFLKPRLLAEERRPYLLHANEEFSLAASPINRLLQAGLRSIEGYTPIKLKQRVGDLSSVTVSDGKSSISNATLGFVGFDEEKIEVDRVIVRVGPSPALEALSTNTTWAEVHSAMERLDQRLRPLAPLTQIDREPLWPDNFF